MSKEEIKKENERFYLFPVLLIKDVMEDRLVKKNQALFEMRTGQYVTSDIVGISILNYFGGIVRIDPELVFTDKKEAKKLLKYYNDKNSLEVIERFLMLEKRFKDLLNNLKQA
jgi:hypothetical protein